MVIVVLVARINSPLSNAHASSDRSQVLHLAHTQNAFQIQRISKYFLPPQTQMAPLLSVIQPARSHLGARRLASLSFPNSNSQLRRSGSHTSFLSHFPALLCPRSSLLPFDSWSSI